MYLFLYMNGKEIVKRIRPILLLVAVLWIVFLLSLVFPLNKFGIIPRQIDGLWGVLFSPFLHESFSHITANSMSLLVLGSLLAYLEHKRTSVIMISLALMSGLGTWLIGRSGSIHIGASGMIYGILGYLIVSGIFKRDLKSILLSILVFFLYGGLIFGVLPVDKFVSWEGHLCGFLSGIILAWTFSKR